jgi:hypothetical protein
MKVANSLHRSTGALLSAHLKPVTEGPASSEISEQRFFNSFLNCLYSSLSIFFDNVLEEAR